MSCLLSPITTAEPPLSFVSSETLTTDQQQELFCGGWTFDPEQETRFIPATLGQLQQTWKTQGCPDIFNRMFNVKEFDSAGFSDAQQLMSNALYIYFSNQKFDPSIYSAPVFQSQLLDACYNVPGICTLQQENMCQECTRDQISSSYNLIEYCGCFAPRDPLTPASLNQSCDSLCTNSIASKNRSIDTGEVQECNQTVCIIDKVSLAATSSSLQNINFSQVCSQCSSNSQACQCYIDVSVPNIIEQMGLQGPLLDQECPYNQCFIVDGNQTKQVECSKYNNVENEIPISKYWYWLLLFLLFIFIVAVCSFAYWSKDFHQVNFTLNIKE